MNVFQARQLAGAVTLAASLKDIAENLLLGESDLDVNDFAWQQHIRYYFQIREDGEAEVDHIWSGAKRMPMMNLIDLLKCFPMSNWL